MSFQFVATVKEVIPKQVTIFISSHWLRSPCVVFTSPPASRKRLVPRLHNCLISFTHRCLKTRAKPLLEVLDVVVTSTHGETVGIEYNILYYSHH